MKKLGHHKAIYLSQANPKRMADFTEIILEESMDE